MSIVAAPTPIFNPIPVGKRRSGAFRDSGWISVDGYWKEADELSRCMWRNREKMLKAGKDYTHFISLNIEVALPPKDVAALWSKIGAKLRKQKLVGLWIREVSPTDHVNYHIISKSTGDVEAQLRNAIPAGVPYHLHVQKFDPSRAWYGLRYVTKAKTSKYFNGRLVSSDRWGAKRTFFQPGTNLDKWGTVGKFWEGTTKAKLWQEIKDDEKRIAEGMTLDGADELVDYLDDLTDGLWGKAKIRRAVGSFAKEYDAEGTLKPPPKYEYEPPLPKPTGNSKKATKKPRKAKRNRVSVAASVGNVRLPGGVSNRYMTAVLSYPQYHPP